MGSSAPPTSAMTYEFYNPTPKKVTGPYALYAPENTPSWQEVSGEISGRDPYDEGSAPPLIKSVTITPVGGAAAPAAAPAASKASEEVTPMDYSPFASNFLTQMDILKSSYTSSLASAEAEYGKSVSDTKARLSASGVDLNSAGAQRMINSLSAKREELTSKAQSDYNTGISGIKGGTAYGELLKGYGEQGGNVGIDNWITSIGKSTYAGSASSTPASTSETTKVSTESKRRSSAGLFGTATSEQNPWV